MRVIGFATEFLDWTTAAFGALPKDIIDQVYIKNAGQVAWTDKAQAVYENWERVDLCKFANNVVRMEITDWAIGSAARSGRAAPGYGTALKGPASRLKEEWDTLRRDAGYDPAKSPDLGLPSIC